MHNWTGVLKLSAEERQGKTVTENLFFQGAFKIMRPVYMTPEKPSYYILNPGGGYLDGDTYKMKFALAEDAKVTLTTQSATKIYKTPNKPAYQEMTIHLKKGSYLEYLPDALIAYKNARYIQKNKIYMEKGATLLYWDILTPGWSPDGDLFSYHSLQLLNEIYLDDDLIAYDHIKLNPEEKDITNLGFMEGYTHLGSFIIIDEKVTDELLDQLYETITKEQGDFQAGLSLLEVQGCTIRIMAHSTQVIERIFSVCHHIISEEWFQTTPSSLRKY